MLSYKQYLQEGLVKVEQDTLNLLTYFSLQLIFSAVLNTWGKPHTKENIEKIKDLIESYTDKKKNYSKLIIEEMGNLIETPLKSRFYNIDNVILEYRVLFDYPNRNTLAGFGPPRHLMVNVNSHAILISISKGLERGLDKRSLMNLESDVRASIEHEIIHAIRDNLHKIKGIAPPKFKSSAEDNFPAYVTSDIEVESWAANAKNLFRKIVNEISLDIVLPKEDLKILIKWWLGDESEIAKKIVDKYSINKTEYPRIADIEVFFNEMKKQEPKKYKKIVNKIYRDLDFFVNELTSPNFKSKRQSFRKK